MRDSTLETEFSDRILFVCVFHPYHHAAGFGVLGHGFYEGGKIDLAQIAHYLLSSCASSFCKVWVLIRNGFFEVHVVEENCCGIGAIDGGAIAERNPAGECKQVLQEHGIDRYRSVGHISHAVRPEVAYVHSGRRPIGVRGDELGNLGVAVGIHRLFDLGGGKRSLATVEL